MEDAVKFRPIPITILDFLAVFIPGFVWLLLIASASKLVRAGTCIFQNGYKLDFDFIMPFITLNDYSTVSKDIGSPVALFVLIVLFSLVIGYVFKPFAMKHAHSISKGRLKPFIYNHAKERSFSAETIEALGSIDYNNIHYPFNELVALLYKTEFGVLSANVATITGIPYNSLMGSHPPFSTVKRILRSQCPELWEECERFEAEVRMIGSLLIAFTYGLIYSVLAIAICAIYAGIHIEPDYDCLGITAIILILASCMYWQLINGFIKLRWKELTCTYNNFLIAWNTGRVPVGESPGVSNQNIQ